MTKFQSFLFPTVFCALACGAETATDTPLDSQTHWLTPCDGDSECGEYSCLCGVCAKECSRASDCDGTPGDTCVGPDEPSVSALCREVATVSVCLARCDEDDDCGNDERCEASECIPERSGSTPEPNGSAGTGQGGETNEQDGGAGGTSSGGEPAAGGSGEGGMASSTGGQLGVGGAVAGSTSTGGMGGSGVSGSSSLGGAGGANGDPYALPVEDGEVIPGDAYRSCSEDAECVLVESLCSQCCGRVAINESTFDEYQANYADACEDYEGAVCDCQPPEAVALCVDAQCVVSLAGAGPEELCTTSGGSWETACGHWTCGEPPSCDALTPGCNCGSSANFDEALGCVEDPGCEEPADEQALCADTGGEWDDGSCGHYACGQPPACAAVIPGCVCGPTQTFEPTLGCVENVSCSDPDERALCENTDGLWDEGSCGHYQCGNAPDCDAVIPGCNCGQVRTFGEEGCAMDDACGR